jgi:hypothetical protein
MAKTVDGGSMSSRPRSETSNNREPSPKPEHEAPHEMHADEDDRVVFSSWDCPLVPPLTRRDRGDGGA